MKTFGAEVYASPSDRTNAGRSILEQDPDSPGSLGIAISEAVEAAATSGGTKKYCARLRPQPRAHAPDRDRARGARAVRAGRGVPGRGDRLRRRRLELRRLRAPVRAQQPRPTERRRGSSPSSRPPARRLTKGRYLYDFGDTVATTPLLKMFTLGHSFIPAPVHAGGLRYHGMAPIVSALHDQGLIEAVAVPQNPVFEAAVQFARAEAIIPAPEAAHAIKVTIDEALRAKEEGVSRVIAFNLSGHGHFDMGAYDEYFAGNLPDYEFDSSEVDKALAGVPS